VALAEGERKNDAKRPISGEGTSPKVAEACSEAVLRGQQGLLVSTNEAKGNGQRSAGGSKWTSARQDGSIMLPMHDRG